MPPALDLEMINQLGRDLHPVSNGLLSEEEVCPWTLFLTMALTLLKGVLPHVPKMLPMMIQDEEMRARVAETFMSEDFNNNIEEYFVQNIKEDIQAPLNRQILKSSETVMYAVDLMNNLVSTFLGPQVQQNDFGTTDEKPRFNSGGSSGLAGLLNPNTLGQVMSFAKTLYNLA